LARFAARLGHLRWDATVGGAEALPKRGPALIVMNSRRFALAPWVVSLARWVLDWCPLPRGLSRQVDALMGTVLTTHLLHQQFVEKPIACDAHFPMVDRSPGRLTRVAIAG